MKSIDEINSVDLSLYNMQGQVQALGLLKSVTEQYHYDSPQIPSFLLITQPGMGRETTARAISAAIHGEYIFRNVTSQSLDMGDDIYSFFKDGTENTTYYFESAELLSVFSQNTILKVLRDNILYESCPLERQVNEYPFVRGLIFLSCATTKPLFRSLVDLIDVQFRFEPYTAIDIGNVLRDRCRYLKWDITEAAQQRIATQANTPEQCIRLLSNTYRITRGRDSATTMTIEDVQKAMVHFKMTNIKASPDDKIPF